MPNYKLTKKAAAYLTIEIDGKSYDIPLVNTMKVKPSLLMFDLSFPNTSQVSSTQ